MARIIAEAGVRLRVDGKGLALEIRQVIRTAMREAQATQVDLPSPTRGMADDADRDSNRLRRSLGAIGDALQGVASRAASAVLSGSKLLLIGAAAGGALGGITSLVVGVGQLVAAAGQAAGVVGLLPAVFAAVKASTAAIQLGLSGMGDAMSAIASGDAVAFDEALKNLAPAARDFAREVKAVKPAFDEMKLDVQQALFMDLADVVKPLADTYLPIATAGFQGVARQAGMAARSTADFLLQGAQVQKVSQFSAALQESFGNVARAIQPAVGALLDLVTTGSSFLPGLTASLSNWATAFSQRISEAAKSGELADFFQRSIDALRTLGDIAGNVFGSIRNIIGAADAQGAGFLQRIQEMTQRFQDFTGSAQGQETFGAFFDSMQRAVDALGPAFFDLITILGRDFIPILADLAEIIGPVLHPLFQVLGNLLQALRPLIGALAEAFATALEALGPFFDALAEAIQGAMPTLGPIIQDIGEAFAQLFEAMVPLAPLFVQLLEAILPILPPFIQMIAEIMPEIIDLIEALMPVIQALADAFVQLLPVITDIVNFLLNVLVPIFQFVGFVIGGLIDIVTGVLTGIWDVVTTVLGAIGEFFANIWNDITSQVSAAWNAIGDFFSGGISGIVSKVGQFATNLWNGFKNMMSNVLGAVGDGIGNVVSFFAGLPGKIFGAIGDLAGRLVQLGKDAIQGLINGLKAAASKVINFFKDLISDAVDSALSFLGISSPSKLMKWVGEMMGAGLVQGIAGSTADVVDAAAAMAKAAADAATVDAPGVTLTNPTAGALDASSAASGSGNVFQQTNIMRPGTDVQQFSQLVMQRGFGDVLSGASTLGVRRNPVQAGVDDQWVNL